MVSSSDDLITGIVALLPHKTAVLLLLSSMLIQVDRMKRVIYILVFSSALPLGILLAGLISGATDNKWVMVTLEAVGAGAVFHVAMLEMLPEGEKIIIILRRACARPRDLRMSLMVSKPGSAIFNHRSKLENISNYTNSYS